MKTLFLIPTAIVSLALFGLTGCTKNASGGTTIDTAKLQSAFSAASSVDKAEVEKAISAIKSADYSSALASLKQALANVKLTPEQQSAIKDTIAQIQAKLGAVGADAVKQAGDAAKQAGDAAAKAAKDLQK